MNCSVTILRSMLLGTWVIASTYPCMAEPAVSTVESLMSGNRWQEASQAIFREARSANRFELSIPVGQANAGFLEDALETIAGMHPNMQPGALLALVAEVPSMAPGRAVELVRQAHDRVGKISGKSANYLKSGELTKIALFHAVRGAEREAWSIFEEALRAAERGSREEGSGGYRQITEVLVRDSKGGQDWMITLVAKHLRRKGNGADSAFAYRDLAMVAAQHGKKELCAELIASGISAADGINPSARKKLAVEELVNVAVDIGYTKGGGKHPYEEAIQEARSGNPQKALAIASGLSQNLYVDHGQEVHRRIFDDAVKREDLNTALYFAEHPLRPVSWVQAHVWRQVAELQAKRGARDDAARSYRRAGQAISGSQEAIRYQQEVSAMLALSESLRRNGFVSEGRKTILEARSMIDHIPERRTEDRARAGTQLAEMLWRAGMHAEAKQQALQAYRAVSGYGDRNAMEKSRLLSGLGVATTTFTSKARDSRGESKG